MPVTTLKVVQLTHQRRKDGTIPILIRLTQGRKSKYVKTGYAVKENQFKEGTDNWVVKHPDAHLLNMAIEKKRSELMANIIKADLSESADDVEAIAGDKPKGAKTMFGAVKSVMTTFEIREQVASYNRLNTNLRYLKECWGKDLSLTQINKAWVQKFANHRFELGNSISTVKKSLEDLGTVLTHVDFEGKNHFAAYATTLKAEPVKRDKLTIEEIGLLESADLEGLTCVARDMFLFSFYCHGMRFENVATFSVKSIQNNMIIYRMNKGKDIRQIEIHNKLLSIIDKYKDQGNLYLFPAVKKKHDAWNKKEIIGSANTNMRNYLTRAAIIAGITKPVHFHMARHTFATIGLQKGVSMEILKDALGHSKFDTTQKYLKSLTDDVINEAVRKVFD